MNEARVREILHEIVGELVANLFVPGIHSHGDVQDMSDHLHHRIDTLEQLTGPAGPATIEW